MREITTAPYKTMRVVYDDGICKKQHYDSRNKNWKTVGYYRDYAEMMREYHKEVARNERLIRR